MNEIRKISGSIILKGMCLVLALIISNSLFAAGTMASADCGMKCCCQTGPTGMPHHTQRQMRSSIGFCNEVPLSPCGLQSTQPYKLPEVIPVSCCGLHHVVFGPSVILSDSFSGSRNSSGNIIFLPADQRYNSPPLYLQNHAYLI
jgi:hypothetical protein